MIANPRTIELSLSAAALEGLLLQTVLKEYLRASDGDQRLRGALSQLFAPQPVFPQSPLSALLPAAVQQILFVQPDEEAGRQFYVQSISPTKVDVLSRSVGFSQTSTLSLVPEAARTIQIRLQGTARTGPQFQWIIDPAGQPGGSNDSIKDVKFRLTVNAEVCRVIRVGDVRLPRSASLSVWLEVAPKFDHGSRLDEGVLALEYIRLGIISTGPSDLEHLFQQSVRLALPQLATVLGQIAQVRQTIISTISELSLPVNNLRDRFPAEGGIPGMSFIDNLGIALDESSRRVIMIATLNDGGASGLRPDQLIFDTALMNSWINFYHNPPVSDIDRILVSNEAIESMVHHSILNAINAALPSLRASARAGMRVSPFGAPTTSVVNQASAWVDDYDAPVGDQPEIAEVRREHQASIRTTFVNRFQNNLALDPEDRANPDRLFDHLVYQLRRVKAGQNCPLDLEQSRDAGRYLFGLLFHYMLPGEELIIQQRRLANPARPVTEVEQEVFEETQRLRLRATGAVPATPTEVEAARAQLLLLGAEGDRDFGLITHILRDIDSGWFPPSLRRRWWAQTYPTTIIKDNTGPLCVLSLVQGDFDRAKIISTWYSLMRQYAAGVPAGQINCSAMVLRPDIQVNPYWRSSLDSEGRIQVSIPIELRDMAICPVNSSADFSVEARLTISALATSQVLVIEGMLDLDVEDGDISRCLELVGVAVLAVTVMAFAFSFAAGIFVALPLVLLGAAPAIEQTTSSPNLVTAIRQGWTTTVLPELMRSFPGVNFQLRIWETDHRIFRFTVTATGFLSSLLNSTAFLPGQRSIQEVFNPFGIDNNALAWSSTFLTAEGLSIMLELPSLEGVQGYVDDFSRRIVAAPREDSQTFRLLFRSCELPTGSTELIVDGGVRFTNPLPTSRLSIQAITLQPMWLGQIFQATGLSFPFDLLIGQTLNIGPRFVMSFDEYYDFGRLNEQEIGSLDPAWLPVQMLQTASVSIIVRTSVGTWQFFIGAPFRALRMASAQLRRDPFTSEIVSLGQWQTRCRESRLLSGGWDLLHRDPRSVFLDQINDLRQGGDYRDLAGWNGIVTWLPPHVDLFARTLFDVDPAMGLEEFFRTQSRATTETVPAEFLLRDPSITALEDREVGSFWEMNVVNHRRISDESFSLSDAQEGISLLGDGGGGNALPSGSQVDVFSLMISALDIKTSR